MQLQEYDKKKDKFIIKSNELIQQGHFNLSVREQRLVLSLISKLNKDSKDFEQYEISLADLCRLLMIDPSGQAYEEIKATLKGLADKSWWLDIQGKERLFRWIDRISIDPTTSLVSMRLCEDLKPYLLNLKKNFTTYELIYTLNFKSKYSFRLYEFIKSIHYNEDVPLEYKISVDDLRAVLGAETYTEFNDFNPRVLKPAIKEINEQTDKDVYVVQLKSGRKVTALCFCISNKTDLDQAIIHLRVVKTLKSGQIDVWGKELDKGNG